ATMEFFGTIRERRDTREHGLYAKGDVLFIDGGTLTGLEVGSNYVVRRTYDLRGLARGGTPEHTAGLVQIVSTDESTAGAAVVYACDELMRGDRLALFEPEPVRIPEPFGVPAYDDAARILFADIGQLLGMEKRLMVIDRGTTSNIRVGQVLTLFRNDRGTD